MYCPSCGAWNPDDSKFCGKCGRSVRAAAVASRQQSGVDAAPSGEGTGGTRSSRGGLCLVVLMAGIILALAAVAIGAYVLRDQLGDLWPKAAVEPTAIVASPTPAATSAPVVPTATLLPSPSPELTATQAPTTTPVQSPTPSATPTPRPRTFKLAYSGCIPHAQSLGSVKGQVLNKNGSPIAGAKVRVTINGYDWQSDANPATTNPDGWYEWILQVDQQLKFVELIVDGKSVSFAPTDVEVKSMGGCFQRVDFIEQ